ncbi:MAG: hypothetical protein OXG71_01580, partial [Rhodospirillales bacterium]|nr:hypothetical protein [Rhodospirillales bacterium]
VDLRCAAQRDADVVETLESLVEPFAARYVAAGYAQIAPYAVLILVLIFRPHGLFAQVSGKKL